jgi:potassium voltage-gated channel Eag-related subfamily H protein 6
MLVTEIEEIRQHYFSTWFFVDVVSTLPINIVLQVLDYEYTHTTKLLRLFVVLRCVRLPRIFAWMARESGLQIGVQRLAKLFFSLVLMWHWVACCYWYISGKLLVVVF